MPVGEGAMIALIGADVALAEEAAKEAVSRAPTKRIPSASSPTTMRRARW